LIADISRVDRDRFDPTYGVRAGIFVVVPLVAGIALGEVTAGVLVALGALNLLLVQAPRPGRTPTSILAIAVGANAVAWAVGTIVGTMAGPIEWTLVGLGVFVILLAKRNAAFNQQALVTSVMYVVAVGLPGGWGAVLPHAALVALGGAWGFLAAVLPHYARWVERSLPPTAHLSRAERVSVRTTIRFSVAVALTVALALAAGELLGLPRDYWVMLTVLAAFRPELMGTLDFATLRVLGTVAGAAVVFGLTLAVTNVWALVAVVVTAASLTFATRAVNYVIYSIFLTIYIIVLLALAYHGGPMFAVDRVLDTVLGGGFAIVAGLALSGWRAREGSASRPPGGSPPSHAV
jgi:hypothetical protein